MALQQFVWGVVNNFWGLPVTANCEYGRMGDIFPHQQLELVGLGVRFPILDGTAADDKFLFTAIKIIGEVSLLELPALGCLVVETKVFIDFEQGLPCPLASKSMPVEVLHRAFALFRWHVVIFMSFLVRALYSFVTAVLSMGLLRSMVAAATCAVTALDCLLC